MQNPTGLPPRRTSLKFFDLLELALRHWRRLLLVPLLVGVAAYGASYLLPRSYVSAAILVLPSPRADRPLKQSPLQAASMLVSPLVLDEVVQQLGLYQELDRDRARLRLARRVQASLGKDALVRLQVEGSTPEEAQKTATAVLNAWLRSTVPSEREQADLKRRLEVANAGFASTQRALSQLVVETPLAAGRLEAGMSVVAIGELGDRYLDQILFISREIEGMQREVIRQAPTLPTWPVRPRKAFLAVSAALLAFVLVYGALLLRYLMERGRADPHGAENMRRLREALAGPRRDGGPPDA
jgi:LPS O-antigen subunit length determinant protein (WzzB/FepE family)